MSGAAVQSDFELLSEDDCALSEDLCGSLTVEFPPPFDSCDLYDPTNTHAEELSETKLPTKLQETLQSSEDTPVNWYKDVEDAKKSMTPEEDDSPTENEDAEHDEKLEFKRKRKKKHVPVNNRLAQVQKFMKTHAKEYNEIKSNCTNLDGRLKELEEFRGRAETLKNSTTSLWNLESRITVLESKQAVGTDSKIEQVKRQFDIFKTTLTEEQESIEESVSTIKNENAIHQGQVATDLRKIDKRVSNVQTDVKEQIDLVNRRVSISDTKGSMLMSQFSAHSSQMDDQMKKVFGEIESLKRELNKVKKDKEDLQAAFANQSRIVANLESRLRMSEASVSLHTNFLTNQRLQNLQ